MNILTVGDVVGKTGIEELKNKLPKIVSDNNIDFTVVNGENAADGMGITEKMYREILSLGVNVVTMGNHTWGKKEIFKFRQTGVLENGDVDGEFLLHKYIPKVYQRIKSKGIDDLKDIFGMYRR